MLSGVGNDGKGVDITAALEGEELATHASLTQAPPCAAVCKFITSAEVAPYASQASSKELSAMSECEKAAVRLHYSLSADGRAQAAGGNPRGREKQARQPRPADRRAGQAHRRGGADWRTQAAGRRLWPVRGARRDPPALARRWQRADPLRDRSARQVFVHDGRLANQGHFWACVRRPVRERSAGQEWVKFNDAWAAFISEEQVRGPADVGRSLTGWLQMLREATGGSGSSSAYYLVYVEQSRLDAMQEDGIKLAKQ